MDSNYLQQQRFLLQKKVKRLNSCDYKLFHSLFVQFWGYLRSHPLYAGVLAQLAAEAPQFVQEMEAVSNGELFVFESEKENIQFNFRLMEYCAAQPLDRTPEVTIGRGINGGGGMYAEMLDGFREGYLEPFYEYLDEAIDGTAAVLSLLLKYKRHVEWFERDEVRDLVSKGGERMVAKHMYAYLFDQGLEFHIEPQSVSGEADLVAPELVLDAKLFDGESARHGKRYVLHGVNQLITYTRDFQQQVGYLVVYRTCPEDLQFSFARSDLPVPFLVIDGRIIYFLVIDICEYSTSASKRGVLKTHLIGEDEVRAVVSEQASTLLAVPEPPSSAAATS